MQQRFEYKYLPKKNYYIFNDFFNHHRIKKQNNKLKINNIYFDTSHNFFYFQHIDGVMDRIKIRIRWYENSDYFNKKFFLEIKRKINHISKKYRIELTGFKLSDLQNFFITDHIPKVFRSDFINFNNLNYCRPKIFNSYSREYFVIDGNLENRVTYDSDLNFYKINDFMKKYQYFKSNISLIEHKYLSKLEHKGKIFNNNLTKTNFSKYIYGVTQLYKNITI